MEIRILENVSLQKIPSGSGIVKHNDRYYVIGDDSPFLFALNNEFQTISKTQLIETPIAGNRISKSEKPDFETLEMISDTEMAVFGSGSKSPQRNVFIRILLQDSLVMERYDISEFYDNLKKLPVMQGSELNIEATAFHKDQIYLFNRKKNVIFRFDYIKLLSYFRGESAFPTPIIQSFVLPEINDIEAGFSGATVLKKQSKIIFTASVENTDNAYDDGEILGSFIGMIDLSDNYISDSFSYCEIPTAQGKLKIESVTIEDEISSGKTLVVLIADDDKGNSTVLKGKILW